MDGYPKFKGCVEYAKRRWKLFLIRQLNIAPMPASVKAKVSQKPQAQNIYTMEQPAKTAASFFPRKSVSIARNACTRVLGVIGGRVGFAIKIRLLVGRVNTETGEVRSLKEMITHAVFVVNAVESLTQTI